MSNFIITNSHHDAPDPRGERLLPLPPAQELSSGPVRVRDGQTSDLPFIDALQRKHNKAVGWMPTGQLEGHLDKRHVIVAETTDVHPQAVGYCIGVDRYFKREDVGIIYQMNIDPKRQRGLVGATLLKAMFERSAYGVRLFCCWCAQDLPANRFWEAMGFTPLAFRSGSRRNGRTHIFWQKRIRSGDTGDAAQGGTPWWYPSQTGSGALREDRIVLPIPPGVHWSEAKPKVLPGMDNLFTQIASERSEAEKQGRLLESPEDKAAKKKAREAKQAARREAKLRAASVAAGGLRFGAAASATTPAKDKTKKPKVALKNDPKLVAAARELRDRWLEQATAQPGLIESGAAVSGKYEVSKVLTTSKSAIVRPTIQPLAPNQRDDRNDGMIHLPAA